MAAELAGCRERGDAVKKFIAGAPYRNRFFSGSGGVRKLNVSRQAGGPRVYFAGINFAHNPTRWRNAGLFRWVLLGILEGHLVSVPDLLAVRPCKEEAPFARVIHEESVPWFIRAFHRPTPAPPIIHTPNGTLLTP